MKIEQLRALVETMSSAPWTPQEIVARRIGAVDRVAIAEMRNHFEALLDVVEAFKASNADHGMNCAITLATEYGMSRIAKRECTCGLEKIDAAIARLEAL